MKRKVAFLMIALIVSVGFRDVFTVLSFYSQRAVITEAYCVNINRPELMCNGQCYLARQMQHKEDEERSMLPFPGQFDHFQLISYIIDDSFIPLVVVGPTKRIQPEWAGRGYPSESLSRVFQPPELAGCIA